MEAKVIDGCISCGACIATCPEVFRFDEDGLAEAYAKVTPEHESAAIEAKEEYRRSVALWMYRLFF